MTQGSPFPPPGGMPPPAPTQQHQTTIPAQGAAMMQKAAGLEQDAAAYAQHVSGLIGEDDFERPQVAPTGHDQVNIEFYSRGDLWGLAFKNFLLKIVTLGIYSFWGNTAVRKQIWSSVYINGEPCEYTGTGGELFKGFLVIMAVMIPLFIVNGLLLSSVPLIGMITYGLTMIAFMLLIGAAVYLARRYRASRTNWRGIRGGMTGSSVSFSIQFFLSLLALPFSLGWSHPYFKTKLTGRLTRETTFGNIPFDFEGSSRPLYKSFAFFWIPVFGTAIALFVLGYILQTLGIYPAFLATIIGLLTILLVYIGGQILFAFYMARQLNVHTAYTSYHGLRFGLNATMGGLVWLVISNMLLVVFTLTIGQPIAQERMVRFFIDHLAVDGATNFATIAQSQQEKDSRGEGLAGFFDTDGF